MRVVKEIFVAESSAGRVPAAHVTTAGSNVFVVWEAVAGNERVVRSRLFDSGGAPVSNETTIATATVDEQQAPYEVLSPVASWNGSGFMVAWTNGSLFGALMSPSGDVVKTLTFAQTAFLKSASIAWDGFAHLLTWQDTESNGKAALLSASGDVFERFDFGGSDLYRAAIASNGRNFIVVRNHDVTKIRSTGPTRVESLPPITRAYQYQEAPAIAAGASSMLIAWFERGTVYATRLTPAGIPIDSQPIEIGTSVYDFNPNISIAAAGDLYVVVWSAASTGLRFARVTADGRVLDPGGVPLAEHGGGAKIATSGEEFLVIWSGGTGVTTQSISSAVIRPTGAPAMTSGVLTSPFPQIPIQLVWTGSDYALGWLEYQSYPCQSRNCSVGVVSDATRFTRDGNLSSTTRVLEHGGLKGLQWNGSELVIIYNEVDGLYSKTLSGGPRRIGSRADFQTAFTRSSSGFNVFTTFYGPAPFPQTSVVMISLDRNGAPLGSELPLISEGRPSLTDATFAFGRAWLAFTTPWKPMPEAHEGFISRAFYRSVSDRRRNIGPR